MKQNKLIKSDENGWYYSITEKGLDYLQEHFKD